MLWAKLVCLAFVIAGMFQYTSGHMSVFSPIPRGDKRNKEYKVSYYGIDAAIYGGKFNGKYPCRYQEKGPVTGKYTAGKNFTVEFMQGSPHMGGHCQFALSYDNGETWVVLRTVITMCFQGKAPYIYNVFLPKGALGGNALFGWTYIPSGGRKEFYMTCSDIEIEGGANDGSITGPEMLLARMPNTIQWPSWQHKDGTKDGREHFNDRKVITIPSNATSTTEGTVVGEACGGKPGAIVPPMQIPWDTFIASKYEDNNGARSIKQTNLGVTGKNLTSFFIATSDDYRGGTGDATQRSPTLEGGLPYSSSGSKSEKSPSGDKTTSTMKKDDTSDTTTETDSTSDTTETDSEEKSKKKSKSSNKTSKKDTGANEEE
ncbi:hypothetical protein BDF19DRAFT_448950 [Syncephalis fuscata]|nr:hypothetical protein BDF19DRAFT_448950 [Syncephalis fuscata]